MTDTKNWKIDTSVLPEHKEGDSAGNYFSETADGRYGVYIYNISEWRMMSYAGLIAIYSDKHDSKPLTTSVKTWIWYDTEKTFSYAPLSDCLIFRKPASNPISNKPDFPFIVIKPREHLFGFIEWDATSIYYGFAEVGINTLIVTEVHPKDLNYLDTPKRTNEMIDLNNISWFDIEKFDEVLELYHR